MKEKIIRWNSEKNELLKQTRKISFEDIIIAFEKEDIITIIKHSNPKKYPNQKIFIVRINYYIYMIPFVETNNEIFLKTIIPSRKMANKYLK